MSRKSSSDDSVFNGVSLIIAAVFVLSLADAAVKYFSSALPLWQLFLIVSCLSVPALAAWIGSRSKTARIGIASVRWIMIRSLLLLLMWVSYYSALPLIPLSVAAVAIYTTPIFIALISTRYAGESLSPLGWAAVAIGFSGVALVLRPGAEAFSPAALLPVIGAVFYALAMVVTRRHCRNEHPLVLAFGLNIGFLGAAIIGGIASLMVSDVTAARAQFLLLHGSRLGGSNCFSSWVMPVPWSSSTPPPPGPIKLRLRHLSAPLTTPTWPSPASGATCCSVRFQTCSPGQECC